MAQQVDSAVIGILPRGTHGRAIAPPSPLDLSHLPLDEKTCLMSISWKATPAPPRLHRETSCCETESARLPEPESSARPMTDRQQRELDRLSGVAAPKRVDVALGQLVPLLIDAATSNRSWLNDFADDAVRIDADLYEVLLAYKRFRQQAAA
jgi:hypothetical protein